MSKIDIIKEDYLNEDKKLKDLIAHNASEREIFIQKCLVEHLHKELIKLERGN